MKEVKLVISGLALPQHTINKIVEDLGFQTSLKVIELKVQHSSITKAEAQSEFNKLLGDTAVRLQRQGS